jgi:DNA-binding CsgD family transcriptional regulator
MTTSLSPRELEIVNLICQRKTDREIATALGIQRPTVSAHLSRISEKLGLHILGVPRRTGIRMWREHQLTTRD